MEREEVLETPPPLPPLPPAMDNPVDWIQEKGADDAAAWYAEQDGRFLWILNFEF